ncbi:MAG: YqiJ family protein [Alphaproteobacteria bacterium]|nr:YqiJ family protein [Alphaproteobacteria bacterium]
MSALIEHFLAPEVRPFAISAAVIALLGGIELVSMLLGVSLSHLIGHSFDFGHGDAHPVDHDAGFDHDSNPLASAFSWVNAGGTPLLIFLLLALGIFAITGFFIQGLAGLVGTPMPAALASIAALVATVPLTRQASRIIARAVPRDETYVVSAGDLVGRVGDVVIGPLDQGLPGRVSVADIHGNRHMVMARAVPSSKPLPQGTCVLLVDRDDSCFLAIEASEELRRPPA